MNNITKIQKEQFRIGSSTKILVGAIALSCYCLFTLLQAVMDSQNSLVSQLMSSIGMGAFNTFSFISLIISLVPMGLLTVALWVIWAHSRSQNPSTLGYTFGLVTVVIKLISICVISVIVVVIIFISGAVASALSMEDPAPSAYVQVDTDRDVLQEGAFCQLGSSTVYTKFPETAKMSSAVKETGFERVFYGNSDLDSLDQLFGGSGYSGYGNGGSSANPLAALGGFIFLVLLLILAGVIMAVIWAVKLLKMVLAMRRTIVSGRVEGPISQYVIVLNFFIAVIYILSTIFGIFSGFNMDTLASIANIVYIFCVTLSFMELRRAYQDTDDSEPVQEYRQQMPVQEYRQQMPVQDEDSVTVPINQYGQVQSYAATGALEGVAGMYEGAIVPVEVGTELIIGRDESTANLVIKNPKISRKHCGVRYSSFDGTYTVTDYSSNGLFYKNGQAFPKNTPVTCKSGTIFVIAQSGNEFRLK